MAIMNAIFSIKRVSIEPTMTLLCYASTSIVSIMSYCAVCLRLTASTMTLLCYASMSMCVP